MENNTSKQKLESKRSARRWLIHVSNSGSGKPELPSNINYYYKILEYSKDKRSGVEQGCNEDRSGKRNTFQNSRCVEKLKLRLQKESEP